MIKQTTLILLLASSLNLQAFERIDSATEHAAASDTDSAHHFSFRFPAMTLVDHRNRSVELGEFFAPGENVVFAFFFTHCISICTTLTYTLQNLQPQLPAGTKIAMISIDPDIDTDTPELLNSYAARHQIDDANWYLLTGETREIVELQKSFEAFRGNKMNHTVSLFLKRADSAVITKIKNNFANIPGLLGQG